MLIYSCIYTKCTNIHTDIRCCRFMHISKAVILMHILKAAISMHIFGPWLGSSIGPLLRSSLGPLLSPSLGLC